MVNLNNSEKRLVKLVLQNEALQHYNKYLKTLCHGEERKGDSELELSNFYNKLADKIEKILEEYEQ